MEGERKIERQGRNSLRFPHAGTITAPKVLLISKNLIDLHPDRIPATGGTALDSNHLWGKEKSDGVQPERGPYRILTSSALDSVACQAVRVTSLSTLHT